VVRVRNRNEDRPDLPANYQLDYHVKGVRHREPAGGSNKRAAQRLAAQRQREIDNGTWKPPAQRAVERLTVEEHWSRYFASRKLDAETATSKRAAQTVGDQEKRVLNYVLPHIGKRPLASVEREDIRIIIQDLVREGRLSPRSIHHVYDATRGMFTMAASADPPLIGVNPCTLKVKPGELPKKRDKNPTWRKGAVFTHGELLALFTDERNQWDRRVFFAILFFGGMRFGEGAGRRWRDYDASAQPLGRLAVYSQYDGQALKGEGEGREVPVHPFLAWMLRGWRERGFELVIGRKPKLDDLIVPSRAGRVRSLTHMGHKFHYALELIGLRRRSMHDLRASFITLAQDDGGDPNVLRTITHQGNKDVWTGYSRHQWAALCDNVLRLRFPVPEPSAPSHIPSQRMGDDMDSSRIAASNWRGGRDLNPRPPT